MFDSLITKIDRCLRAWNEIVAPPRERMNPAHGLREPVLSEKERRHAASLMRVNHSGEICAQALYLGQSLTAREPSLATTLCDAAREESDHLRWCQHRITELNSHTSYLNPVWFIGSFTLGTCAGLFGDRWSLGFLAETEKQVVAHLESHLEKLPAQDEKSRTILHTMQREEQDHATTAIRLGAATLPLPIKIGMRIASKIMTTLSYKV